MKNDFHHYFTLTDRKNRHAGSAPGALNDRLNSEAFIYLNSKLTSDHLIAVNMLPLTSAWPNTERLCQQCLHRTEKGRDHKGWKAKIRARTQPKSGNEEQRRSVGFIFFSKSWVMRAVSWNEVLGTGCKAIIGCLFPANFSGQIISEWVGLLEPHCGGGNSGSFEGPAWRANRII